MKKEKPNYKRASKKMDEEYMTSKPMITLTIGIGMPHDMDDKGEGKMGKDKKMKKGMGKKMKMDEEDAE